MSSAIRPPGGATAGAALTRYAACKLSSGKVVETTAVTEKVFCVTQDSADADGDEVDVIVGGLTKAIAGGVVAVGDKVVPTADGKFIKDNATASRHYAGRVVHVPSGTVADGDIIYIDLDVDALSQ